MARPGITYQEVATAATRLMEQNIRPSIEAVRNLLKTGSNSTINRHLRDWRAKQGVQVELEQGLPEPLLIAVRGLYEAVNEDASQKCTTLEAEHNQVVTTLKSKIEALEKNQANSVQENSVLLQKLDQTRQEKSALERRVTQLDKDLEAQAAENTLLDTRLTDKVAEIERLSLQMKQVQANLEHYRESIRAERLVEKQHAEEKRADLERQLHAQQAMISSEKEQHVQLRQQLERLDEAKSSLTSALKGFCGTTTKSAQSELFVLLPSIPPVSGLLGNIRQAFWIQLHQIVQYELDRL